VLGDVRDRPRRRNGDYARALSPAVAIVIIALAGCGGGDGDDTAGSRTASTSAQPPTATSTTTGDDDGSVPETLGSTEAVRTAVEVILTSADPADACGKYVTDRYLKVAYGGKQGCAQAQAPGSVADTLDFKDLRIDGRRATAVVVPSGGPYSGERLTVSVVNEGPRWAVDELESDVPVGP
jgi:hypothetical protein